MEKSNAAMSVKDIAYKHVPLDNSDITTVTEVSSKDSTPGKVDSTKKCSGNTRHDFEPE